MPRYVDGFLVPLPKRNVDTYRRQARKAGKVWIEHGALEVRECWADDVKPGKVTSFPQAVKLKAGEAVVFSWVVFTSKGARNRINAKVMKDPRLADMMESEAMPFDAERMVYGGFDTLVHLTADEN